MSRKREQRRANLSEEQRQQLDYEAESRRQRLPYLAVQNLLSWKSLGVVGAFIVGMTREVGPVAEAAVERLTDSVIVGMCLAVTVVVAVAAAFWIRLLRNQVTELENRKFRLEGRLYELINDD